EWVVAATQRVISAMAARQAAAVARYSEQVLERRDGERAARHARGEGMPVGMPSPQQEAGAALAPILRIAPRTMVTRIHTATTLTGLPVTAAMAWAGELEPYRVTVITAAARGVGHEQLAEFEARLHHRDIGHLPASRVKTRAELIAARLTADPDNPDAPDGPDAAVAGSAAQRAVRVGAGEQAGLTRWDAQLPADTSLAMWAAVDTLAARYRADAPTLTVAQSRADALTDLVLSDVHVTTTATLIIPTSPAPAATATPTAASASASDPTPPAEDVTPTGADLTHPAAGDTATTGAEPPPDTSGRMLGRLAPPAGCGCPQRPPSWIDLLDPLTHPTQLSGPWAAHLPDPPLQRHWHDTVARAAQVDATPNLARDRAGHIWFIPKPVTTAPVGLLLPAQVTAILANPDTLLRLGTAHPHTGAVTHLDHRTYRPGAALARLVRARDGTCRYPGCTTPAHRCDLDHVTPYPDGPTTASNLQTLCRVHHGLKHHSGWTVHMTPDATCTWTAPNGRTHTTHPHTLHDDAA
ncbi:MAG: HNH endonuclease signature motif containing protein, partial [Dermatophilaceae bacterium]